MEGGRRPREICSGDHRLTRQCPLVPHPTLVPCQVSSVVGVAMGGTLASSSGNDSGGIFASFSHVGGVVFIPFPCGKPLSIPVSSLQFLYHPPLGDHCCHLSRVVRALHLHFTLGYDLPPVEIFLLAELYDHVTSSSPFLTTSFRRRKGASPSCLFVEPEPSDLHSHSLLGYDHPSFGCWMAQDW